jgi:hypothetical protein
MSIITEDGISLKVEKYAVTEMFIVCYYYSDFLGRGPYFSKGPDFKNKQEALDGLSEYLSHSGREGAVIQRTISTTTNPESNLIRQIVSSDVIVERRKSLVEDKHVSRTHSKKYK